MKGKWKMFKKYIGKYCVVRANEAGVFAGVVVDVEGTMVQLTECRRLWAWNGACSISQIAIDGTVTLDHVK